MALALGTSDGDSPSTQFMYDTPFDSNLSVTDPRIWTSPGDTSANVYHPSTMSIQEEMGFDFDAFDSRLDLENTLVGQDMPAFEYPIGQPADKGNLSALDETLGQSHCKQPLVDEGTAVDNRSTTTRSSTRSSKRTSNNETGSTLSMSSPTESMGSFKESSKGKRDREKNRVAAHKCRQKAKKNVSHLHEREQELCQQNIMLREQAGNLRNTVLELKSEILAHSSCDSDVINRYIANAARDFN